MSPSLSTHPGTMQGSDVAFILDFLRQHDLKAAEEALRVELATKTNLLSETGKPGGKPSFSENGSISQAAASSAARVGDSIPQGLPPVRIHSSHDLVKAGEEEPVQDKGKRKSVSDLSMVPPPLPIAEPVTSPAISPPTHESSSGSIKHAYKKQSHHTPGIKDHKASGAAADEKGPGFKPTWARRDSGEKAEPSEPTSLQQAREMLLGLAMGGDQTPAPRALDEESDSDEYDDEDDVGYHRQPIENEEAFLANEIENPPSDEEGRRTSAGGEGAHEKKEGIGDDPSFQEEAYFSGEEYYKLEGKAQHDEDETSSEASVRELEQRNAEAVLSRQSSGLGDESAVVEVEDGFGILAPPPEGGANRVQHLGEGDGEEKGRRDGPKKGLAELLHKLTAKPLVERGMGNGRVENALPDSDQLTGTEAEAAEAAAVLAQYEKAAEGAKRGPEEGLFGFSFPEPAAVDISPPILETGGKLVWSVDQPSPARTDPDANDSPLAMPDADDMLAGFLRKSNETSPVASPKEDVRNEDGVEDGDDDRGDSMRAEEGDDDEMDGEAGEEGDEDAAVHEQLQRMKAEEEEFEVFDLRVIHRKNRTGFEEEKDFPVQLNAVVAGRYHVTEYLGSAAFSKAIQAHDLQTGLDVCMKIIKNNKDFFDQSLDEIKLLKFINKHDPADEHHILRLYDYFYHREHLFIVCELLRANLYEFHKYNRESRGEVYFTMARIQCITVQILEALRFLHGLGLLHCDLKPENILVKSYSRCEIKVIDLGSSCFATDHLCSYVQSRSYRAPEVILGLPYDHKIDIWSLGCILAELCSGTVLFQNDSLATLLARVVGILGPIDPAMLARGKDTSKYFTKANMLYERSQETDRLEYLIPKKTSLRHRLPTGDAGFTEFVSTLLETNPEKRPSAEDALKHPWLKFPYEPFN